MSKKLASVMDEIVTSAHEEVQQIKNANLLTDQGSPTISTELGLALLKTAALLRDSSDAVSYDDIRKFMEQVRNA